MLKGYAHSGLHEDALALLRRMKRSDVGPNKYTFPVALKSCAAIPAPEAGLQVHCFAIKTGFDSNGFTGTTLIEFYSSIGAIELARNVFNFMPARNVVAWTAIVRAYLSIGDVMSARGIFDRAVEHDVVLWNNMVSGYVDHGDMVAAWVLFSQIPDEHRDVMLWNTVLLGYANSGDIESCESLFEEMPERNVFSWNGLIGGYVRHGCYLEALDAFRCMLKTSNVLPNDATLVSVLSACSKIGVLDMGRWIHVYAEVNGFRGNIFVGNGLVDMYAKCGCVKNATNVFHSMKARDLITWNSMIGGFAMHGRGVEALELFHQMNVVGERPDGITFVGVLSACAHMGLVEEGFAHFNSMAEDYLISPWIEHYGCMVDLLGRAGLLGKALDLVRKMPMEPDCVIWSALLGACQVHKDVCLAEIITSKLVRLGPEDVTNYVVLSNLYSASGRWKEVARLKRVARCMSLGKLPGYSSVEVSSDFVEFCSSDARHSQTWEIYSVLEGLSEILNYIGHEGELDNLLNNDGGEFVMN